MTQPEPRAVAARIETVTVDPTNVVEAFERNRDEESDSRRHVLRLSPPFGSDVAATPHVLDDTDAPPDADSAAIHLRPEAFVHVHGEYDRYRTRVSIPTRQESRSIARSDHGEAVDAETVEAYHTTAMDAWEECVRTSLADEILLLPDPNPENEVWIDVQYADE